MQANHHCTHYHGLSLANVHQGETASGGGPKNLRAVSETEKCHLKPYQLPDRPKSLPVLYPHQYISSLYLRPFEDPMADMLDVYGTKRDLTILHSMSTVLLLIGPFLRHMIFDAPTLKDYDQSEYPETPLALRSMLLPLTALEGYWSLQDDSYLLCCTGSIIKSTDIPPVWCKWHNLKVLSLNESYMMNSWFWGKIARLPLVHTVVLTRPVDAHMYPLKWIWKTICETAGIGERSLNIYILARITASEERVEFKHSLSPGWHNETVVLKVIEKFDCDLLTALSKANPLEIWEAMPEYDRLPESSD